MCNKVSNNFIKLKIKFKIIILYIKMMAIKDNNKYYKINIPTHNLIHKV